MASDFDVDDFLKLEPPKQPQVPSGVGKRHGEQPPPAPAPAPKSPAPAPRAAPKAKSGEEEPWYLSYPKHFGTAAARGFLHSATELGEDISSGLPIGVLDPALDDVALQEARKKAGEKVRGWTPPKDPNYPLTEGAGELTGESVVPSALAALVPGGKITKKAVEYLPKAVIDWLAGRATGRATKEAAEETAKYFPTKPGVKPPIAPNIRNPKTGQMGANPAFQDALDAIQDKATARAGEAAKTAASRTGKAEAVGSAAGSGVRSVERGAVAGAIQPTEDRSTAAEIGGASAGAMQAVSTIVDHLPPKAKAVMDIAGAAAIVEFLHRKHGYGYGEAASLTLPWFLAHELYRAKIGSSAGGAMSMPLLQTEAAGAAGRLGGGERK